MPRRYRSISSKSPLPDFDLGQAISKSELKVEEVRAHLWPPEFLLVLQQTTYYGLAILSLLSSVPR